MFGPERLSIISVDAIATRKALRKLLDDVIEVAAAQGVVTPIICEELHAARFRAAARNSRTSAPNPLADQPDGGQTDLQRDIAVQHE